MLNFKQKASWAFLVCVVVAVISGTVSIPEPLKEFGASSLYKKAENDAGEVFHGSEVLPERSGLARVKARRDADVDAALYGSQQSDKPAKTESKAAPSVTWPAS